VCGVKGFAKFIVRLVAVFGLVVLLAVTYLNRVGFPKFLENIVVSQLARQGIAARFGSLHLDLFRGVVATQAVIADSKTPDAPLAEIDLLELHWDVRRLLQRKNAMAALRIANATISIPTPPDAEGAEKFTAHDAFATFRFGDDGTIEIDQLMGVYCGIRVYISGQLKPRTTAVATPAAPATGESKPPGGSIVTKVVRELNRLKVTMPPQIDVEFVLDLDKPLAAQVKARMRGSGMTYRGLQVDDATVDVVATDGGIDLQQLRLKLYGGEVKITGRYDIAVGVFDLRLASTTDPLALATLLAPASTDALRTLKVKENPKIDARYYLSDETGSLPRLEARVETAALEFRGVPFESIKLECSSHGPELTFTNTEIVMSDGRLLGHGTYHTESTDFAYEIDSTLDPTKLLSFMSPGMKRVVEPAWFDTPPHVVATVTGDFVDPELFAYDAQVSTEHWRYRGVPMNRASATLKLRREVLDARDLVLVRDEGVLRGLLRADFARRLVDFDVRTTANPTEMAPLLGEKAAQIMQSYHFGSNIVGQARGRADFGESSRTEWSATFASDAFVAWKFAAARVEASLTFTNTTLQIDGDSTGFHWWKWTADRARMRLTVNPGAMTIDKFDADFYAGKLRGTGQVAFGNPDAKFGLKFEYEDVDVRALTGAMRSKKGHEVTGSLHGKLQLEGDGDDLDKLTGTGALSVRDGVLWELALYGPLTKILGKTKATDAKATFSIRKQLVRSDDLEITTGAFTAKSPGRISFDGALDFEVQAQFFRSVPGLNILGSILGKILEYKVGGTLDEPSYRAENLPKELLPHD